MIKILHFADAHIDMANYGSHDPQSGLPLRVMDFLKSLDMIVDTAISEQVDLVIFAGDAYKDRTPAPTFQREWGKRIMRLSHASIPTLLLVGNHDLSPALGRAHALESFDTLEVPNVTILDRPQFLGPDQLVGLPVQVIALPWISRSQLAAFPGFEEGDFSKMNEGVTAYLEKIVDQWLKNADSTLPRILTAHCSIQGAVYGAERTVMLGGDLVLSGSMVRDPRLDYVALGHIHRHQDLNEGSKPPVIYPGSIERVDFGEASDDKYFVIANVDRGDSQVFWHKLDQIRPFFDRHLRLKDQEKVTEQLITTLLDRDKLEGSITRLVLEYPREWEPLIDEASLRDYTSTAFEFHLVKRPLVEARIRIPQDQNVGSLTSMELLDIYWRASHTSPEDTESLNALARSIIEESLPK